MAEVKAVVTGSLADIEEEQLTSVPSSAEIVKISAGALHRAPIGRDKLKIRQSDPNSPLHSSVQDFKELGLSEDLLKGVYKAGFEKPSKIQEIALPNIILNPQVHFVGQAHAGTGKTAAFALSMIARMSQDLKYPQGLVLCPTRELAMQIADVFKTLASFIDGLEILPIVKDAIIPTEITQQILVGTPGTISDLVRRRRFDPKLLRMVVVDEADQMIEVAREGQRNTSSLWAQTQSTLKLAIHAQICLFSATFPPEVLDVVQKLLTEKASGSDGKPYTMVTLRPEELSLDQIHEFWFKCSPEDRFTALGLLFKAATIGSTVIFVNRRDTAAQLHYQMTSSGFEVSVLHGQMTPQERDTTTAAFREGKIRVLITTDVFARGIDIPEITTVINYELPQTAGGSPDPDGYLHRIGRSGRFGADGVAVSFVIDAASQEALRAINAVLCAVDPATGKGKRQRNIVKLELDNIKPFVDRLEEIANSSV